MNVNILDWKFWLFLIILVIIIWWFCNKNNCKQDKFVGVNPLYEKKWQSETSRRNQLEDNAEIAQSPPLGEMASSPKEKVVIRIKKKKKSCSVGEELTCQAFQQLVGNREVIKNIRPSFLINPKTGRALEIDCYCPELGCGVEYNGLQHYQFPNSFNKTIQEFDDQVERDLIKRELADLNGTPIFTVPCTVDAVVFSEQNNCYKYVKRSREKRYELIYSYLEERMRSFLEVTP